MATPVIMPRQGQSVESCVIGAWHKHKGDKIAVGDILFTYETDKATFEEEAKVEGVLLELFFEEGDEVECLKNVCVIGNEGESVEEFRPEETAVETADGRRQMAADASGTEVSLLLSAVCRLPSIFFQTKTANDSLESLTKEVGALLRRSPDYGMLPNTALRCREALIAAGDSLSRALPLTDTSLIALELRNAVNQLGLIDGTVHTEDILDNIFSRFCIGK